MQQKNGMKKKKALGVKTKMPDFAFEQKLKAQKVAGVDEAGCGPWAGPVVASAVIFLKYDETLWADLNDSKKLTYVNSNGFVEEWDNNVRAELTTSIEKDWKTCLKKIKEGQKELKKINNEIDSVLAPV